MELAKTELKRGEISYLRLKEKVYPMKNINITCSYEIWTIPGITPEDINYLYLEKGQLLAQNDPHVFLPGYDFYNSENGLFFRFGDSVPKSPNTRKPDKITRINPTCIAHPLTQSVTILPTLPEFNAQKIKR